MNRIISSRLKGLGAILTLSLFVMGCTADPRIFGVWKAEESYGGPPPNFYLTFARNGIWAEYWSDPPIFRFGLYSLYYPLPHEGDYSQDGVMLLTRTCIGIACEPYESYPTLLAKFLSDNEIMIGTQMGFYTFTFCRTDGIGESCIE